MIDPQKPFPSLLLENAIALPQTDKIAIAKILNCDDEVLINHLAKSVETFKNLDRHKKYSINFSGGKDSHLVLGIYFLYLQLGYPKLKLNVLFADTHLEHSELYSIIDLAKNWCESKGIEFKTVSGNQSYWYIQYALGYPVPNHFNRWCTGKLKVRPMEKEKRIPIIGRHLGESKQRDKRIKKNYCGTNECGTDKQLSKSIEPILHFTNCLVWDSLFYLDTSIFYPNFFNTIKQTYAQAGDINSGSLRLGCFMCPVIQVNTLSKNLTKELIDNDAFEIRLHLEKLRDARRIKSPRTKKNGAIYVIDRQESWKGLNKQYLLDKEWITQNDIGVITLALKSNYAYPPTYKREWIDEQHKILE